MADLEVRRLGKTEIKTKALGLGCAHLGNPARTTDEEAVATVREAIERGIDFIDTAAGYGGANSERRVGLALADGWREKVYLQTKVGSHPKYPNRDFSKEGTIWSLENSFKQLQTEYFDSVLIHGPREIEPPLEPGACLDVLLDWKAKGRIGHIGIGVRQHEFHKRAIETGEMDIVLSFSDYTLLDQSVAKTTIPLALENDIGIILATVLGGSLLAGPEPDVERERRQTPGRRPRAHAMWQWCHERGVSIRDLAMHFVLNAPLNGNGIVLAGPADQKEFGEVYESATADVDEDVWRDFATTFNIEG
jgi:aryl-alcohol dehydrogenase-like predicted oxidoreductase